MRRWITIAGAGAAIILCIVLISMVMVEISSGDSKLTIGKPLPRGAVKPQLVVGQDIAVLLAPDGSLWAWGGGQVRQLSGLFASPMVADTPRRISPDTDWRQVAVANSGIVAVKADGSLWAWSSSTALPRGASPAGSPAGGGAPINPRRIGDDTNWSQISGHISHYMALKNDGSQWGWGQNESGQLGNGGSSKIPGFGNQSFVPEMIGSNHDWKAVSAGAFNSYALKQDGTLWGWGSAISSAQSKTNDESPDQIDPGTNWAAIAAGEFHLLALKSDGSIWLRGQNTHVVASDDVPAYSASLKQIGKDSDWREIYSGLNCFFARKQDGSWWACGDNSNRKLGVGTPPQGVTDSRTGRSIVPGATGMSVQRQQIGSPQRLPLEFEPWAFASGGSTTLLLAQDGTLWTWGTRLGASQSALAAKGIRGVYNSAVEWIGQKLRPRTQAQVQAQTRGATGRGPASQYTVVDFTPHRLWMLPPEVRRSLGKNAQAATNNPARPRD